MRALGVVETDPVSDRPARVLQGLEALPMNTLFLERPYHPLHHPVLLGAVGGNELLLEAIAANQARVVPAGEV